jgi:RHS repeat-associated protein
MSQNTTCPRRRHPRAGPAHDALGRRYGRTAGGTTTVFYYAGSRVLLEKQGDTFTGVYTYGNALLRRNAEYPLYDGHGSERTVTNGSETVTGTINFEAFGQTAGTTGSSSSPYMYAGVWGYRTDGDAGLMHVGARYYDAQVGRFITRDTVLSEHPYLYCEHGPVNAVDPSGHMGMVLALGGKILLCGTPVGWVIIGAAAVVAVVAIGYDVYRHSGHPRPKPWARPRPWGQPRPRSTPSGRPGPDVPERPGKMPPLNPYDASPNDTKPPIRPGGGAEPHVPPGYLHPPSDGPVITSDGRLTPPTTRSA